MKYRIFAFLLLSILALNLGGSTFADSKSRKGSSELVGLLPASDGVVTLDVRRFFNDALPKLLSSNQPMLTHVTGEIDKFQAKTGIDVRQFESIAAGVTTKKVGEKKYDVEPVVIARGQISAASLIGAAKLAANAKYTEERVGERTIYIFSGAKLAGGSATDKFPGVVAVTVIDSTTIAFGSPARVRQTVEGRTRVDQELIGLLGQNQTVASFATRVPAGMKSFIPMENDELGKNIDSIQYVYGNADVSGDLASVHVTARTLQNAQAKSLHETLEGLQMLGKAFLGSAKGADKQAYARMIGNAKFTQRANEVILDLQVPQSDIDILVGSLKRN
jgi:hypothetical protein